VQAIPLPLRPPDLWAEDQEPVSKFEILKSQTEKLTDGGMNAWTDAVTLTNWTKSTSGTSTLNREASALLEGAYSARADIDSSNSYVYWYQASIALKAGLSYEISFWYKTTRSVQAGWQLASSDNAYSLGADGVWVAGNVPVILPSSEVWTKVIIPFSAYPPKTSYNIYFGAGNTFGASSANGSIWFDAASLKEQDWLDLSQTPESQELTNDGGLNIWTDATHLTNWTSSLTGTSTVNRESSVKRGGAYSLRLDVDAGNDTVYVWQQQKLIPGNRYTVSFWYKTAAGKNAGFYLWDPKYPMYLKSDGSWMTSGNQIALPEAQTWTYWEVTFRALPGTCEHNFALSSGSSSASSSIYFDDVSLRPFTNCLRSLQITQGGAGVSPDPIAGTWQAEIDNPDGIFHPKHPTSAWASLLQLGRKMRLSTGGKFSGNLNFDGSNDYAEVPHNSALNLTANVTLEAWVRQTARNAWAAVITKGTSTDWTNGDNYVMGLQSGKVDFRWGAAGSALMSSAIPLNTWTHIVCVAETGTTNCLKIYINGVLDTQANRNGNPSTNANALRFGTDTQGQDQYSGDLRGVRIYGRALAASEVYEHFLGSFRDETSVVGLWKFGEPSGSILDTSGAGNALNGTLYAETVRSKPTTLWQRMIGFLDPPKFNNGAKTVGLAGCDYSKLLSDTILQKPNNYFGKSWTTSTVGSSPTLGSELYTNSDAIASNDTNTMNTWTAYSGTIASAADGGGGSTYVGLQAAGGALYQAFTYQNSTVNLTAGHKYQVIIKYCQQSGSDDCTFEFKICKGGDSSSVQGTTGAFHSYSWVTKTFYFDALYTGNCMLQFELTDPQFMNQSCYIDALSIKEVTGYTNSKYSMPSDCNGPYYCTVDGIPHWFGEATQGWLYKEDIKQFYFSDNYLLADGTNNMVIYYYTNQTPEGIVAALLVTAGLYSSAALALADMNYVPTGITLQRVWFESGMSIMEAIRQLCERANYRFWFDELGKANFRPAPTAAGVMASFNFRQLQDLQDYEDLAEIRNHIIIEGMSLTMYNDDKNLDGDKIQPSAYKSDVSDASSIATYLEKTCSIKNTLFQTQASCDAMAAAMLAAFKNPKWYSELAVPANVAPLQRGDTISWEIPLRAALHDGKYYAVPMYGDGTLYGEPGVKAIVTGIIRDVQMQGSDFRFKCEMI